MKISLSNPSRDIGMASTQYQSHSASRCYSRSRKRSDGRPPEKPAFRIERELAVALDLEAISVHYQPQYDVATGRCCGVEALARWVLSTGENVAPSAFIPAAEQFGMIHDLGSLMLKKACETTRSWCSPGAEPLTLSVNVSTLQIDAAFCRLLEKTLKQFGFPARQLELEITESALIVNPARTIDYLNDWKKLGVRIAIDDFGTGYSSLSYLTRLPVDRLKIDRSLVERLALDCKSVSIMRLILALATELGFDVIAEGVETKQELRILADLGCPKVQGYLLGRPMPARQAQIALTKTCGHLMAPSLGDLMAGRKSYATRSPVCMAR
jgi:EAL domain-containing protein (putative c-di-GMP-specific phosphodiesterase class I)